MRVYQVCAWMISAALVLLAGSSASEAGWLREGCRCYYYPAYVTSPAATIPVPAATPQTAAPAPASPMVYQTYKPVNGVQLMPAVPSPAANYAPSTTPGSGWSVTPRNSWDFGRFPPYR